MQLGISDFYYDTDSVIPVAVRYRRFQEAGFSCIDFNTARTDTPFYTTAPGELEKLMSGIRAQVEDQGLRVHQVHGPWCWPPLKDETPEGRVLRAEEMKHSMRLAAMLGSKYWVVHPIMPHRVRDIPEGNAASTWELNVEFMSWLLEYAKQLDITVCLENMPHRNFSMAKPEKVLELLTLLDDPHFQMCLDTGHVATQEGLDLAEQVRMIGKHLKALHVHDNGGEKDEHRYPGKGVIDWRSFACALKDVGFDGVFSLETAPADGLPEPEYVKELGVLSGLAREIVSQIEQ